MSFKPKTNDLSYFDPELGAANKGYFIEFYHIPTGHHVQFKGLLTQFQDRYECGWESTDAYGRNDPIENFKGTKRVISIGWLIMAASLEEAKNNLKDVNLLLSMLYPVYDESTKFNASSIAAGPLFKFSYANLVRSYGSGGSKKDSGNKNVSSGTPGGTAKESGLVGRVGGFTFDPDLDLGMFDPEPGILYPKKISLACEYTVYHTHPLGWDRNGRKRTRLHPYGEADPVSEKDNESVNNSKAVSSGVPKITTENQSSAVNSIFGPQQSVLPAQKEAQQSSVLNSMFGPQQSKFK